VVGDVVKFFDNDDIGVIQSTALIQELHPGEFVNIPGSVNAEFVDGSTTGGAWGGLESREFTFTFFVGVTVEFKVTWDLGTDDAETEKNFAQAILTKFSQSFTIPGLGTLQWDDNAGWDQVGRKIKNELRDSISGIDQSADYLDLKAVFQDIVDKKASYVNLEGRNYELIHPAAQNIIDAINLVYGSNPQTQRDHFNKKGLSLRDFPSVQEFTETQISNFQAILGPVNSTDLDLAGNTYYQNYTGITETNFMVDGIIKNTLAIQDLSENANFTGLSDTPTGYLSGQYLVANESGIEYKTISELSQEIAGAQALQFTGLSDTPTGYLSGQYLVANESGIEYKTISGLSQDITKEIASSQTLNFTGLSGTPDTYNAGQFLQSTTTGVEWVDAPAGGGGGGGSSSGANVVAGNYTGDGSNPQTIELGFRPAVVHIRGLSAPYYGTMTQIDGMDDTNVSEWKTTASSAHYINLTAGDLIEITDTGFKVSGSGNNSGMNHNTSKYYYYAISEANHSVNDVVAGGGAFSNQDIKGAFAGDFTLPDAIVVPITRSNNNQLRIFHLNGLYNGTISSPTHIQYEWIIGNQERYTIDFDNDSDGTFETHYNADSVGSPGATTSIQWLEIQSVIDDKPTLKEFIADNKAIYYGGGSSSGGSSIAITQDTYVGDGESAGIYIPLDFIPVQVDIQSAGTAVGGRLGSTTLYLTNSGESSVYKWQTQSLTDYTDYSEKGDIGTISGKGFLAKGHINDSTFNVNGHTYHYTAIANGASSSSSSSSGGGGGGSSTLLGLTDTPTVFAGASGKYLTVNSNEDAVEFAPLDLGDADLDFSVESTNVQFIEKKLGSNINSDQTISDFTFPNLIVGKTYRVSATLSFYSESETNLVQAEIYNGANKLVTLSNKGRSTTASASMLFIAAHDSVTVEGKNLSSIDYILGGTNNISIVQLELPPSAIVTVEQQVVNPSNPPASGIFTVGDVNVHASINDFQNHSNELSQISSDIFGGNIIQAANINSTINIQDISTQNTFEDIDGALTSFSAINIADIKVNTVIDNTGIQNTFEDIDANLSSFGVMNIADMKVNTIIRDTGFEDLSSQSPFNDHSLSLTGII
jgi:hypothetical protein